MKRVWIPQTIVSAMLLWALYPGNPYDYYIVLRVVCCGVFLYLATRAFRRELEGWVWILGITAVVYNPFARVHLTRSIWSVVNVVTVLIAIGSILALRPDRPPEPDADGNREDEGDGATGAREHGQTDDAGGAEAPVADPHEGTQPGDAKAADSTPSNSGQQQQESAAPPPPDTVVKRKVVVVAAPCSRPLAH